MRLILIGIGVAAFLSSVSAALLTHGDVQRAGAALIWLAGALHQADWQVLRLLSRWLVPLMLGRDSAVGLGVPVALARSGLLLVAVGVAAGAVLLVGPFGFVALIAPHLGRRLMGHRSGRRSGHSARSAAGLGGVLLCAALCGAILVACADVIGRNLVAPLHIPAGMITMLLGGLVMLWLMTREKSVTALIERC